MRSNPRVMSTHSTSAPAISRTSNPASSPTKIICRRGHLRTITCRRFSRRGRRPAMAIRETSRFRLPFSKAASSLRAMSWDWHLGPRKLSVPPAPLKGKTWNGWYFIPRKTTCLPRPLETRLHIRGWCWPRGSLRRTQKSPCGAGRIGATSRFRRPLSSPMRA